MSHVAMGRILTFCSYAHEDEQYLADLEAALVPLREEAIIDGWSDKGISAGMQWDDEIKQALEKAHLILFVVTPHLLQSDYINTQEIPLSLARRKAGKCEVVPILAVRPDDDALWHANALAKLQPLPRVGRWISDYTDPVSAYKLVCLGIRDACGRIGGGNNPFVRAQVGDWRHCLRRCEFPNGEIAQWEFTEEVTEKTDTGVTVQVQTTMHGPVTDKRITYDLTTPLQSQAKDIANQAGLDLSQVASMSMSAAAGGPDISEEILAIGFDSYETRVQSLTTQSELNGLTMETRARLWSSIDVPFDGAVKVRQEMTWPNGAAGCQSLKLLGFGFGDASSSKPVPSIRSPLSPQAAMALGITPPASATPTSADAPSDAVPMQGDPFARLKGAFKDLVSGFREGTQQHHPTPPPQWRIFAGRWALQARDGAGSLDYDVMLDAGGRMRGMSWHNGLQSQLHGGWGFDPNTATLRLDVSAVAQGQPPCQYWVTFRIVGSDATAFHASDMNGRAFRVWLIPA